MKKHLLTWLLLPQTFIAVAQPIIPINLQSGAVISLPVGAAPNALAIADYNQDNRPDIAVCQRGLNSVGVYLQAATGIFPSSPAGTYPAGQAPSGLVAVPLGRAPARPDIDLVAISGPSNQYTLLTNNKDGTGLFTPVGNANNANYFGQATGLVRPQLLARDLDGDGWIDFAYTQDPAPPFTFQAGAYSQRLTSPTTVDLATSANGFRANYRPSSLALADFDRDGIVDVVTTNPDGNEFTVVFASNGGNGQPGWRVPALTLRLPSAGTRPVFVATGDVNGDLLPDIALAHEGSAEITIFLNSRNFSFGAAASYPLSAAPRQVLLQDLNGDRLTDMLVLTADNKLQVFQHTGASGVGRYGTPIVLAAGGDPVTLQVADVDGDYVADVVVGCAGDNTVRVFLNRSGVLSARAPQLAGVEVYPNPTHGYVTVQRAATVRGVLNATFFDAVGRTVHQMDIAAPTTAVPLDNLQPGVYVLRLSTAEGVLNQRLVVD